MQHVLLLKPDQWLADLLLFLSCLGQHGIASGACRVPKFSSGAFGAMKFPLAPSTPKLGWAHQIEAG